jgi:aspartate aminotransferase-like enzyme
MAQPYPVTLPTNNIEALWTGLRRIVKEGLDARFARYQQAAWAVRQGMREMGFELLQVALGFCGARSFVWDIWERPTLGPF